MDQCLPQKYLKVKINFTNYLPVIDKILEERP